MELDVLLSLGNINLSTCMKNNIHPQQNYKIHHTLYYDIDTYKYIRVIMETCDRVRAHRIRVTREDYI